MIIRKLRLQRGWSQEHLSQISGLSSRTIQRIERGHQATVQITEDEKEALAYVRVLTR